MREWQVGDPVGDGNDIGVPDTKYMGYLKNKQENTSYSNNITTSNKYREEAWDLKVKHKIMAAESLIDEAIRLNPNDYDNWNVKGLILWQKFEEIYDRNSYSTANQAYICFNKALEIKPSDNILKENKMLFLYDWADALYDDYHMSESIERIDEYLSLANKNSSDYAKCMNLKGCALHELGNHTEALKCFNKALEISPDNEAFQINQQKLFIVVEEKRVKNKSPLGKEDIEYLANLKKMHDEIDNKF